MYAESECGNYDCDETVQVEHEAKTEHKLWGEIYQVYIVQIYDH